MPDTLLRRLKLPAIIALQLWGSVAGLVLTAVELSSAKAPLRIGLPSLAVCFDALLLVAAPLLRRRHSLGPPLSTVLWAVQIPHIVGPFITIVVYAGWRLTFTVSADADLRSTVT